MNRKATNAGRFYPRFKEELTDLIANCFKDTEFGPGRSLETCISKDERNTFGGICPHAGLVYSGPAAANTINAICEDGVPDTFIILGNTHTGYPNVSIMIDGAWETPIGNIEIDASISEELMSESDILINDESAFSGFPHGREHNIEVQLPFIKYVSNIADKETRFVPIKIGTYDPKTIEKIGESISNVIRKFQGGKDIALIASSDMFHEEPKNRMNPMDEILGFKKRGQSVRDSIKSLNWKETLKNALNIGSICGPQTISTAMIACKTLGATKGDILKYYTSYEKMGGEGPNDYCVAYLSAVFRR
ncbi:MAG: AmmeMemoRadiSam system protein B [Promethearchaeota archaeon]